MSNVTSFINNELFRRGECRSGYWKFLFAIESNELVGNISISSKEKERNNDN